MRGMACIEAGGMALRFRARAARSVVAVLVGDVFAEDSVEVEGLSLRVASVGPAPFQEVMSGQDRGDEVHRAETVWVSVDDGAYDPHIGGELRDELRGPHAIFSSGPGKRE